MTELPSNPPAAVDDLSSLLISLLLSLRFGLEGAHDLLVESVRPSFVFLVVLLLLRKPLLLCLLGGFELSGALLISPFPGSKSLLVSRVQLLHDRLVLERIDLLARRRF